MANILCIITYMFFLLTFQIFFGEGRQIRSLSEVVTNYVKSPSHIRIRKLSQIHKSDHSEITPKKITPQQPSADLFQTDITEKNFPSLETHSSPGSSHKADSVRVNKVESDGDSNCLGVKCTDDFRPTAPGHSPGAGHSFVTSTEKTSPNQPTKYPKISNSLAEVEDDFKHTAPGRSPGAGHAEIDRRDPKLTAVKVQKLFPSTSTPSTVFSESALVSTKEFQVTSIGRSPGAGHLDTKQTGVQGAENCLSEKCTGDFRPTSPGLSPGGGHSFINNSESFTSKQGKQPDVTHPQEEGADDFRPTQPGHSPGGGHAVLDKAEPNS